jgi:hypothetical protein
MISVYSWNEKRPDKLPGLFSWNRPQVQCHPPASSLNWCAGVK